MVAEDRPVWWATRTTGWMSDIDGSATRHHVRDGLVRLDASERIQDGEAAFSPELGVVADGEVDTSDPAAASAAARDLRLAARAVEWIARRGLTDGRASDGSAQAVLLPAATEQLAASVLRSVEVVHSELEGLRHGLVALLDATNGAS